MASTLPVIDISALRSPAASPDAKAAVAAQLDAACRSHGFFLVAGHGVDLQLAADMDASARAFFDLPDEEKQKVRMELAGSAWRGWFPVGGEYTSGQPDQKEGLYFGEDLPACHPAVVGRTPLHGPNLFPEQPAALQRTVSQWISEVARLGHDLMRGLARALGIDDEEWFRKNLTANPTLLFRIFHYPPTTGSGWGVGEHTDYGILTMLWLDSCGGLEVFTDGEWKEVAYVPNVFVCNIGDMLGKRTGGIYHSTPRRVRNVSGR